MVFAYINFIFCQQQMTEQWPHTLCSGASSRNGKEHSLNVRCWVILHGVRLSLYPDNALACFHYGMTLYQVGEYEKARSFLNRALSLNPSFAGADTARRVLN